MRNLPRNRTKMIPDWNAFLQSDVDDLIQPEGSFDNDLLESTRISAWDLPEDIRRNILSTGYSSEEARTEFIENSMIDRIWANHLIH